MAWGLIPIAIALVFNQFSRQQQQRSQHHQLSHLETLIQSTQSEQENQQILLWQVKQKAEEIEQSLQEFKRDTDSLKAKTSILHQVETIVEKQEQLEQKQQELEEARSRLESEIHNNFSTKAQVEPLQHDLKQVTQLLDSLVKFQTEQSQTLATKLSELQLNLDPPSESEP
ncbi:MAG: hypothetical protein ACLFTJ_04755 [Halothece sp.]